jgi:short-subunit dehydrogenase
MGGQEMKHIVITGSTRGIGFCFAREFLKRGCKVVISGRSENSVTHAVRELSSQFKPENIVGISCDVSQYSAVEKLWLDAKKAFGSIDIWINNAGIPNPPKSLWELNSEEIANTINTDLTGLLFCCRAAIVGMIQQGHGQIYNMEGHGSDGSVRAGLTVYGAAKRAVRYLSKSLLAETKGTPVQICTLSPGIVITEFITEQRHAMSKEKWESNKKIYNIIADKVETVTPWLVEKILSNNKTGARFVWLTRGKAISRFLTALFKKRDLFKDLGM